MVKAITNAYGTTNTNVDLRWSSVRTRKSNGSLSQGGGTATFTKDRHNRRSKSSNDFRRLPGIKPFRDPSNYFRAMLNLVSASPAAFTTEDSNFVTQYAGFPFLGPADYVTLWSKPVDENGVPYLGYEMDQCVTECLAKLKDRKIDMGTYLAESVKTANQIADLGSSIFRDMLDYSRRIRRWRRNPWGISREIADGYLGFKYGIKPLASDLYAMAQIWNDGGTNNPLIVSASHNIIGRHRRTDDSGVWTDRQQNTVNLSQVKLFATLSSDFKRSASQLGLTDPAVVAWELVPYSFVVDWALPIGTFLEALNATVGLNFLSGYTMMRTSTKVRGSRRLPSGAVGKPAVFEYEALVMRRIKLGGFPEPVPYAKNPFSTSNVLSATALFRQLLRDRSR